MNCIVTAGPTYEPLDQVRRLTNFSTGRLGTELANHLAQRGHHVTLLLGQMATWQGERLAHSVQLFGTTADLQERLQACAGHNVDAVFHAAAVSDFTFGKIWSRAASGELEELRAGKFSTSHPRLLAELFPTPKILARLRHWFPAARIVGWKYEVDGDRENALAKARWQIEENQTAACVANGPAYGDGFAVVTREGQCVHLADLARLFTALEEWLTG